MAGPRGQRKARGLVLLLLLLVGLEFSGCYGYKPLLQPNVPELLINEGEPLEITCSSIADVNIHYPENDQETKVLTSEHHLVPEDQSVGSVKMKFRRPATVFGDTGWYGCSDAKAQVTDYNYDDPSASWIYVYVKSNESAFVQTQAVNSFFAIIGEPLVLPCRPTSPDIHVTLTLNGDELEMNDNLSYNPKVGFVVKNSSPKIAGLLSCDVESDDFPEAQQLQFIVAITQRDSMKTPVIVRDGLQHVIAGSSLHVKCTVNIGTDNNFVFYWTTPRNSSSRTILPTEKKILDPNTYLAISELVEENVSYDDEGKYTCRVKSFVDEKNTSVYIHVYDPEYKYINLSSHDENRLYVIDAYKPVTFTANIDAYPTPTLTWFYHNQKILPDSRVLIENTKSTSALKIKSVKVTDTGVYNLQASYEDRIEHLNFTLEVLVKPWVMLNPSYIKPYYGLYEKASFSCRVVGNPISNVSWHYMKCPSFPATDDCEKSDLTDMRTSEVKDNDVAIDVEVSTVIEMSGKINCTACNSYGCDSVEQDILVSDGTDSAFEIKEPDGTITVGDNITITCIASIYNFSSITWLYDQDEEVITNTDRVNVVLNDTSYTHRAHLTINDVKNADGLDYYCKAKTYDDQFTLIHYNLVIADPQKPYLTNVNMNGSEVIISANESHHTRYLLCYAHGMPKPIITWYKDNEPIEETEQFNFSSDKQELTIKYLLPKDTGKYSCVAKNRFGEDSRFQNFIVKGFPIPTDWIAAISCLIIILTGLLIYFCIRVRREKIMRKQLLEAGLMHFEEGALDCINPELTVDDQAELLPYDRKWEFPREKLKLGKQLGCGAFGVVMKAEAHGIRSDESVTTVAVKMVRKNAEPAYIRALASELKIMVHLGKHLNVVNLLGACTNNIAKRELLVIVEFCRFGNLHNYLLRHRDNFIDQIDQTTGKINPSIGSEHLTRSTSVGSNSRSRLKYTAVLFTRSLSAASSNSATEPNTETVTYYADTQNVTGLPELNSNATQPGWRSNYTGDYKDRNLKPICTQDLLSWAFQVARGMEYLSQRKVLHGDLAARNILLAENGVVKICDFGLAKTMYKDDNYQKQGNGPVPIKWMAIESIRDRVFSTQSDIWSFGIVLWEFFTLAKTPYPSMDAETQYQKLVEGYRLEQPKFATKDIYDIMLSCWKSKPILRPSFTQLAQSIGDFMEEGLKMHYVELNSPYLDMNEAGLEGKDDYLTMMSAPDHELLASPLHDYVNSSAPGADSAYLSMTNGGQLVDARIFSPRPASQPDTRFHFPEQPSPSLGNAAHSDGEDAPMLKRVAPEPEQDEDNYLKPIDVNKKREEFMKQRAAEKRREMEQSGRVSTDRDSGYCNTPKNLDLIDIRLDAARNQTWQSDGDVGQPVVIIKTQDNYVNMPQQKNDKCRDVPDSFMNPSYIFVESNKPDSNRQMY